MMIRKKGFVQKGMVYISSTCDRDVSSAGRDGCEEMLSYYHILIHILHSISIKYLLEHHEDFLSCFVISMMNELGMCALSQEDLGLNQSC